MAAVSLISQQTFYDDGVSAVLRKLTVVSAEVLPISENSVKSQRKFDPGNRYRIPPAVDGIEEKLLEKTATGNIYQVWRTKEEKETYDRGKEKFDRLEHG